MFISIMLEEKSIFLVELTFSGSGATSCNLSVKMVPNTGSFADHASSLLKILQTSLENIIKS